MITLKQTCFTYGNGSPLFHNLNLHLEGGQICGLLGKNGAGKTTLLKIIAGLCFVQSGQCDFLRQPSRNRSVQQLQSLYHIPEIFYLPPCSIDSYLHLYAPLYPQFDTAYFAKLMDEMEIPRKQLQQFSQGQAKKFLLAFGLATQCPLLILDEPTNGLDIPSKSLFRKMIKQAMNQERLIVISTHQVKDVETLIDRVLFLEQGSMIFNRTVASIAQALVFSSGQEPPAGALYTQQESDGVYAINKRMEAVNEPVKNGLNLELLFQGVLNNAQGINDAMDKQNHTGAPL